MLKSLFGASLVAAILAVSALSWHRERSRILAYGGCGQRALGRLLEISHVPKEKREVVSAGLGKRAVLSAAELEDACEQAGLEARTRPGARLSSEDAPCVAWLAEGHFVVVESIGRDKVRIYDPSRASEPWITIGRWHFDERFGGVSIHLVSSSDSRLR